MKVNSLKRNGPDYPDSLRNLAKPPEQLYWLGAPLSSWVGKPKVAIVGSRKVSAYGREVTAKLASELARQGVVIISGLALGIDSVAHQAALEAGGITIAVMPAGLDKVYPASHTYLGRQIVMNKGCLVSEYAAGQRPFKQNFIARNRIVAGLADGILITEAASGSGSLHTAHFGLEQGKVVMAVPGNINSPTSAGTNSLIKSGATPVTDVDDVLFSIGLDPGQQKIPKLFTGTEQEKQVFEMIAAGIASQEELATQLEIDGASLAGILTMLEINGHIRPAGAGNWLAV